MQWLHLVLLKLGVKIKFLINSFCNDQSVELTVIILSYGILGKREALSLFGSREKNGEGKIKGDRN